MPIRTRALALLAAAALTATAAGCAKKASDPDSGDARELTIGVDIEKSGPAAVQGQAYERALRLVAAQLNRKGVDIGGKRRTVRLVVRDNKSDPAESLTVAKSLIDNDHVSAVIGGGSSPTTMSLVDTVERRKVPLVSMGSSGAIVTPLGKRHYVFKTPGNTDVVADVMLRSFRRTGIHRVAVLSVDNAYGSAGLAAWQQLDRKGAVDLVDNEKVTDRDKDYTVQVTKLLAKKPDAVVVWAIPPGAGIAAKALAAARFPADHVYFDTGAGAELFVKGAGKAAEGMRMVHSRVLAGDRIDPTTPALRKEQAFYTAYHHEYGAFSGFAPMAADALTAVVEAARKAGSTGRTEIRDALEHLSFDGAFGGYRFSPTDHGGATEQSLALMEVEDGAWRPV